MSDRDSGPGARRRDLITGAIPLLIVVALFVLGLTVLMPFLPALLWGVVLSIALKPLHGRFARGLGGRELLATWVMGLVLVLVLVLPIAGLSRAIIAFIPDAIDWLSRAGVPSLAPDGPSAVAPVASPGELRALWRELVSDIGYIRDHFGDEIRPIAFWLIGEGRLIGTFVLEFALGVVIAAILMHRAATMHALSTRLLSLLGGEFAQAMGQRVVLTIRSTVLGLLGSAAGQTAALSLALWLASVPHWPILAVATFLLATIQIGPILVWGPAAIWLWSTGETGFAVFLAAWGLVVVGLMDNVIRTAIVSRAVDLPAVLAFLGAVGGLLTWGIVGIFLGPVIIAVCRELILAWAGSEARVETPADGAAAE